MKQLINSSETEKKQETLAGVSARPGTKGPDLFLGFLFVDITTSKSKDSNFVRSPHEGITKLSVLLTPELVVNQNLLTCLGLCDVFSQL